MTQDHLAGQAKPLGSQEDPEGKESEECHRQNCWEEALQESLQREQLKLQDQGPEFQKEQPGPQLKRSPVISQSGRQEEKIKDTWKEIIPSVILLSFKLLIFIQFYH